MRLKELLKKIIFQMFPGLYWYFRGRNYYNKRVETECEKVLHKEAITALFSYQPKKVLEYGVGNAAVLKKIHERDSSIQCFGVDISKTQILSAKDNFPGAEYKVSDLRKLGFPDNYFDVIYGLGVLIYIKPGNRAQSYKELYRICNCYLIAVEYITKYFSAELKYKFDNAGDYRYDYDIEGSLHSAGFEIIKSKKIETIWNSKINIHGEMPHSMIICKKNKEQSKN